MKFEPTEEQTWEEKIRPVEQPPRLDLASQSKLNEFKRLREKILSGSNDANIIARVEELREELFVVGKK